MTEFLMVAKMADMKAVLMVAAKAVPMEPRLVEEMVVLMVEMLVVKLD